MGEIYDRAMSFESIYQAMDECSRGVKWKDSVLEQWLHKSRATCAIIRSISGNDTYIPLTYHKFIVREPKVREIYSTRFRDRVIQRSVLNSGLYKLLTRGLIFDNFACQKGKGTDMAIKRMKHHMVDYFKQHGNNGYICKIDIKKFFPSIPHKVAKDALRRKIKNDKELLKFSCDLIDFLEDQSGKYGFDNSFGKRGIAPGSEFSQLVALNVLDPIDHFMKDEIGVKHYIRYMDDIIFFYEDKNKAKELFAEIRKRLSELGLELNPKSQIQSFKQGVVFLKFHFRMNDSGKLSVRMNDSSKSKERRKLLKYKLMFLDRKIGFDALYGNVMSWADHIKYAQSGAVRKKYHFFAEKLFGIRIFLGRTKFQTMLRKMAMKGFVFPLHCLANAK